MSPHTDELLDEIVRLLVLVIRRDMESQKEAILALLGAGFEPSRIADLVGTTAATVRATRADAAKRTAA